MNWELIFISFVLLCFIASAFENYRYVQRNKRFIKEIEDAREKRKQDVLERLKGK